MNVLELRRRTLGKGVYKKTVEGNPAIAQGSLSRRYPSITMQGWTEQDSTVGKNLFNLQKLIAIIPETVDPNIVITLSVGGLKANTQYTLSAQIPGSTSGDFMNRCIYLGDDENISSVYQDHPVTKQTDNTGTIMIFFCNGRNESQTILDGVGYVQLEEGAVETTYEPYTGGEPSPSPDYPQEIVSAGNWNEETQKWEYEVKLAGAQLFDVSQLQSVSTSADGAQRNGVEITGLEPGQYTISTKTIIGTVAYLYANVKNSSGEYGKVQYIVTNISTDTVAISISSGDTLIVYDAKRNNTVEVSKDLFDEYGMMVNAGSEALPYEPYRTPQTVTLTADRPLTKWDKLTKKNGVWGWEYGSAEIVFDGSDDENWSIYDSTMLESCKAFFTSFYDSAIGYRKSFCDHFINRAMAWNLGNKGEYSDHQTLTNKYFVMSSEIADTVSEWKTFLQSNPITVWYETTTKTFVQLSASEQEQMNALHTNRPTTVLSNDADCEMTLTYKTKKSLEMIT